MKHNTQKMT